MSNFLHLPISLGEAIDKLTILHIKLGKINDHRKNDVQKEYDFIYEKMEKFIVKYNELYQTMKKINLLIWDMMDILRDGETSELEYLNICKKCVDFNDIRFRIKNKINYLSDSLLREQKSYKTNRLAIEINDNIQNVKDFSKAIKYYSFIYDEICICSNNSELQKEFIYDPTIIFVENIENIIYKKKYTFMANYSAEKIQELFDITNSDLALFL